MREIKFRVWDKKNERMGTVILLDFTTNKVVIDHIGRRYEASLEDVILMQNTGVKDKNKIEIWEGDILFDFASEEYCKVVYDEGGYQAEFRTHTTLLGEMEYEVLIEGNIFHNPEMIEEE